MKKLIRLTESDLHRIVKESVKKTLKEHRWDDPDFNEDDYSELLNYKDVEDSTKTVARNIVNACIRGSWSQSNLDLATYLAGNLLSVTDKGKKKLEDMDVTLDDIVYLYKAHNIERLEKIYDAFRYGEDEMSLYNSEKQNAKSKYNDYIRTNYGYDDANVDASYGELDKQSINDPDFHRNLNIGNSGWGGQASLAAQGAYGKEQEVAAKALSPTIKQSFMKGKKRY